MRLRFTIRDLFVSIALTAIGAACLRPILAFDGSVQEPFDGAMMLLGWFGSGMSIGAAITGLLSRGWLLGATAGLFVQFILLLIITGAY